jgi:hypothetical protein
MLSPGFVDLSGEEPSKNVLRTATTLSGEKDP